jgi:hypothetical protein
LPSISNAKLAFYGCAKLNTLPNKILANNRSLTRIDGLFANSFTSDSSNFEITKDFNLFNLDNPPTRLSSAKGVFAGCTKLHGKVGNKFFEPFANVTDLGSGAVAFTNTHSASATTVQGFFTNTGIEAIHEDCLRKAIKVTSCDKFLCKISDGKVIANETFEGFFNDSDEDDYSDVVPANFFLKYDSTETLPLTKLSYMFAGCSCLAEINEYCRLPNSIQDTQGMFYNCLHLNNIPQAFLKDKDNLQNVSYMFAGCTVLSSVDLASEESIFKGCTRLANCKGMFMKSGLINKGDQYEEGTAVINSGLFDDCRSSLKNTSYMFADCTNLGGAIGTGYAQINREEPLKARYADYKQQVAQGLITSLNATLNTTRDTVLKKLANAEFDNENDFSNHMLQAQKNNIEAAFNNNGFKFDSFTVIAEIGILSESTVSQKVKLNSDPEPEEVIYQYKKYIVLPYTESTEGYWTTPFDNNDLHSFDIYRTKPESKVVEIKKYGLLANCPNLSEVEGMFLNCDHLIGPIPADMFYGETTSNISSLAYLFCGCTRLATVPSESSSRKFSESCTVQLANANDRYSDHNVAGNYQEVYPHLIYDYSDYEDIKLLQDNVTDQAFSDMRAEYFVPKDWLAKLRNVTNISHIFSQVGSFDILTNTSVAYSDFLNYASKGADLEGVPLMLKIPNELFSVNSNNFRISNAAYAGKNALHLNKNSAVENVFELIKEYDFALSIASKLADGGRITLVFSDIFDKKISEVFFDLPPSSDWNIFKRKITPPSGAAYVNLQLAGEGDFDAVRAESIEPESEKYRWWNSSKWIWNRWCKGASRDVERCSQTAFFHLPSFLTVCGLPYRQRLRLLRRNNLPCPNTVWKEQGNKISYREDRCPRKDR